MRKQLDSLVRNFHLCVAPGWVPNQNYYPAKTKTPPLEREVELDRLTAARREYHVPFYARSLVANVGTRGGEV